MNKFWNKWLRQIHRWLAVPTAVLIPIFIVIKFFGSPALQASTKPFEMAQSILMLVLAITGSYLYLLPYLVKARRKNATAA